MSEEIGPTRAELANVLDQIAYWRAHVQGLERLKINRDPYAIILEGNQKKLVQVMARASQILQRLLAAEGTPTLVQEVEEEGSTEEPTP